jgi:hypothetical protein
MEGSWGSIGVLTLRRPLVRGGAAVMELFLAKRVASVEDQSSKTCRFCKRKLALVRTIVESDTGAVVHMFECHCGERIWRD